MTEHTVENDAATAEAERFGLPLTKCPACGEVKFVGHGPLCGDCWLTRITPPGKGDDR